MKTNKPFALLAFLLFGSLFLRAQSSYEGYGKVEKRFVQKELSHEDSAAFIEAGMQRGYSLIEYSKVHIANTNNYSNQSYVVSRVPELFYVAEGETLPTDSIIMLVRAIIQKQLPKDVEIVFTKKAGVLGHIETLGRKPKFEADLILIKKQQKFGNDSKDVWQVFLTRPVLIY